MALKKTATADPIKDRLLSLVLASFVTTGRWPLFHEIQKALGIQVVLRPLIDKLGPNVIRAQSGLNGEVSLALPILARAPEMADDMQRFAATLRYLARHLADDGATPLTSDRIAAHTGAEGVQLARLGELVFQTSRVWSSASGPQNGAFSVTPSEDAYYFGEVKTFDDYVAVIDRLEAERVVSASQLAFATGSRKRPPSAIV